MQTPFHPFAVWFGALSGLGISIILGTVFILVFYLANTKLLSGTASLIFKGCICWIAAFLITIVSFAMLKFYNLERKWKRKLTSAVERQNHARSYRWSMFLLAGSATLREGIESVLFLTGVSAGASVKAVIFPGLLGIVLGGLLGLIIYYTGRSIRSLKWFFVVSALLLLFVAAGMVVNGVGMFQYAYLFGTMFPYDMRPWSNVLVWDVSGCCNPNTNEFWAVVHALFGWQAQATNLQLLYYFMYWAITLAMLGSKAYHGTLTDRREAALEDAKSFAAHQREAEVADEAEGSDSARKLSSDGLPSEKDGSNSEDLEAGSVIKEDDEGRDGVPPPVVVSGGVGEPAAAPAVH